MTYKNTSLLLEDDISTTINGFQNESIIMNQNCRIASSSMGYLPWKNNCDLMRYEMLLLWRRILTGILTPLVCVFGIPANITNCIVFYKNGLGHRIYFLLFSHSCTDLAYVIYIFIYYSDEMTLQFKATSKIGGYERIVASFFTNSGLHTLYGFTYASGFISTLIAAERCLCIARPLSSKDFCNTRFVYLAVIFVTVTLVCGFYVSVERYKIVCVYDPELKMTMETLLPSEMFLKNKEFVNIYTSVIYGLGLPTLFILVTIMTTIITAFQLRSVAKWRQGANTQNAGDITHKEVLLTKMLIATSLYFVACKTPDLMIRVTPLFVPEFRVGGCFQNMFISLGYILLFTSTINSSFNIVFYFVMGSKYRNTLKSCAGLAAH